MWPGLKSSWTSRSELTGLRAINPNAASWVIATRVVAMVSDALLINASRTPLPASGVLFLRRTDNGVVLTMNTAPAITLTRPDVQRLERLIASLDEDTPGIEALQGELDRAEVLEAEQIPAGVVTMNSRVHCREDISGQDYHLTLVYPKDAGAQGTVSILAPVGSALIGLRVGQHIDWPTPQGKSLSLQLLAVEYQPEAAGDHHL